MNNPFDNKINEALNNFEMPYDATAWAEFEKQLPQSGGAATSGNQFGWKAAALVAVLATSVATIWYLNSDKEVDRSDSVVVEQVEETQQRSLSVEERTSELTVPAVVAEESKETSGSEKTQIADSKIIVKNSTGSKTEPRNTDSENIVKADNSDVQEHAKKTPPAEKPTPLKEEAEPLKASFIASSLKVCVGEEVSFINESSDLKAKMAWDFGDGTASNKLNPSHLFVAAGNYEVILRTERDSRSADRTVNVTVSPVPVADINASLVKEGYEAIPYYRFETVLQPNQTAQWSFTDGSTATGETAKHLFREAGKSNVTLTVKNTFGCVSTHTWQVENREAFHLLAPTGFSPDGDGNNEVFMPGALPDMNVNFEMTIHDQKGQEVFRTANPTEAWNGKLQNHGNKLDAGVYVWTVVLKDEIVHKKTFTGTIRLLL